MSEQRTIENVTTWGPQEWRAIRLVMEAAGATREGASDGALRFNLAPATRLTLEYMATQRTCVLTARGEVDGEWLDVTAQRVASALRGHNDDMGTKEPARSVHEHGRKLATNQTALPDDLADAIVARHRYLTGRANLSRGLGTVTQILAFCVVLGGLKVSNALAESNVSVALKPGGVFGLVVVTLFAGIVLFLKGATLRLEGDRLIAEADTAVAALSTMDPVVLRYWLKESSVVNSGLWALGFLLLTTLAAIAGVSIVANAITKGG